MSARAAPEVGVRFGGAVLAAVLVVGLTAAVPPLAAAQATAERAGDVVQLARGVEALAAAPRTSPVAISAFLAALGLLPFALVVTTSFAKIAVVLSILRSALGAQNVPPNAVLAALAVILTGYVMAPVAAEMSAAAAPLLEAGAPALDAFGAWAELGGAVVAPLSRFLAANAGGRELELFASLRGLDVGADPVALPLWVLAPAFTITELAEAFQMGFLLFLPFLVLDLLVGAVLLSLGMHMLSPTTVSMPFKLLLFVLVSGWISLTQSLVLGYSYGSPP